MCLDDTMASCLLLIRVILVAVVASLRLAAALLECVSMVSFVQSPLGVVFGPEVFACTVVVRVDDSRRSRIGLVCVFERWRKVGRERTVCRCTVVGQPCFRARGNFRSSRLSLFGFS